ncbi:MAG: bifunctional DNA-formamidopyrimidine glycosylase/DNA-(apurinic or apyrimidinic site) lyase, partial [Gammaproteobacteria bacterium]|nr:bifunctional DNA-formamidopyrimidine glycosylase/DNA-(apurinic or apyrimidinic site) lyase [Gammaproteobacteria bacterium]
MMPELPEVETTCAGIAPHITGQVLQQVTVRDHRLRWPIPDNINSLVAGQRLHKVTRRGKYILLYFDEGGLIGHLGMTGSMRIVTQDEPPAYHDHFDLCFNDCLVRYRDPRRFGSLLWQPLPLEEHVLLAELGPEPLTEDFNVAVLYAACKDKKQPIKTLIMDSKKVVGVGNIYANEALHAAGIRPDRPAGRVSRDRYARLSEEIKDVLASAISSGGTT